MKACKMLWKRNLKTMIWVNLQVKLAVKQTYYAIKYGKNVIKFASELVSGLKPVAFQLSNVRDLKLYVFLYPYMTVFTLHDMSLLFTSLLSIYVCCATCYHNAIASYGCNNITVCISNSVLVLSIIDWCRRTNAKFLFLFVFFRLNTSARSTLVSPEKYVLQ